MSFYIHCYGVDYTPECIQSCTRSRKFAWGPAPQHRCTLVGWQEHTSWHQHWNTARRPHTWLQGLKRFHKLPRAHHCTLGDAHGRHYRHSFSLWCTDGRSLPWSLWMGSMNTRVLASVDNLLFPLSRIASPEHQSIPPWALVGTPPWAPV